MGEVTSIREIIIEGERFEARCSDPYGLWKVKPLKGGALPKELEGTFTSLTEAEKAVVAVMAKKLKIDPSDMKKEIINPVGDTDTVGYTDARKSK